ncbi:MAG: Ig-like domain-containing protein, partial [Nitrolancea sp.]
TDVTLTATVTDQYGNNVADGTSIDWVIEGANASSASPATDVSTTTSGQATFTYHNTVVGQDTVRAYFDANTNNGFDSGTDPTGTADVTWTAGAPYLISVVANPTTQGVGGNVDVTATVTDQYGNNVADGTAINWVVEGSISSTASPNTDATTTTSGQTTFTYSNTSVGQDTVRAYFDANTSTTYDSGEVNGTADVTWTAGAAANITVTPADPTQTVHSSQTETATVTDQYGNAVADGTAIRWVVEGTTAGSASPATGAGTTSNGTVDFTYTNTATGTDTVRAYIDGNSSTTYDSGETTGTTTVTWTAGPAAAITVAPGNPSQTVGQNQTEIATVTDQYGNNVADGTAIRWVVEGTQAGTASPATDSGVTSNGTVDFTFNNTIAGIDTVRAYIDGNTNNSFDSGELNNTATVNWIPGVATSISVTPSNPSQTVGAHQIETATVTDQYGNNVADGTAVLWVVEGTNSGTANPALGSGTTTSGQIQFTYTNTIVGSDTVRAYIDGNSSTTYDNGELNGTATVIWTPDVPASITLSPTAPSLNINLNQTETATVKDQFGNLVADGTTIKWVVEGDNAGTASPASDSTVISAGVVSFTYTNSAAGTDTVRAFYDIGVPGYDAGDPSGTADVTWTYPPPVAVADSFAATGNVSITVPSTDGVLTNDTLNTATLSGFDASSVHGGTVAVDSNGGFTYDPPAGYVGDDTFTYTLTNPGGSSTATVTVTVSNMIWFINNDTNAPAGNDGRLGSPFSSISAFNTAGGGSAGDVIFVHTGTSSYLSGFTLKSSQKLLGQGVDLTSNLGFTPATYSDALPGALTNPTVTNASGTGVSLGTNNTIKGLTIGTTSGAGISGSSFGTLTVGTVTINGGGLIASLATGTLAVTLDSATSTSSTGFALSISGVSGTFTVTGATSISSAVGGVSITSSSSLTSIFNGLTVSNSGQSGFIMNSGGTVTVNGSTNSIATTSGTGLSLTSVNLGASGMTFKSVSASGGANGILVNGVGGTGHLSVTGAGSSTQGGDASGGTIQNTSGAGISLSGVTSPYFNNMKIQNTASAPGIDGTDVHGFAFTYGTISGSGSASHGAFDSNIAFNDNGGTVDNVDGAVTITNNILSAAFQSGVDILNNSGTISDLNISSNTITSDASAANSAGSGIRVQALGSSSSVASITEGELNSNVIHNFPNGAGIVVSGGNVTSLAASAGNLGTSGASQVQIDSNLISGENVANPLGTNCILVTTAGTGSGFVDVSNNGTVANPLAFNRGNCISINATGVYTLTATVNNNVVKPQSQIGGAYGIAGGADKQVMGDASTADSAVLNLTANGNNVSSTLGVGMYFLANSQGTLNAKIQNNTVTAPTDPGTARPAIRVDSGSSAGTAVNTTVCLQISGNTATGSNVGGFQFDGIALRKQGNTTTPNAFGIVGMSPSPGTDDQMQTYVRSQNAGDVAGAGGGGAVITSHSTNAVWTTCTLGF